MKSLQLLTVVLSTIIKPITSFQNTLPQHTTSKFHSPPTFSRSPQQQQNKKILYSTSSSQDASSSTSSLEESITKLKKILELEYTTFFNPMYKSYYAEDVTFTDPMMSVSGVQAYQDNVDMLASRTLKGKLLFSDASIVLHSVKGGEIRKEGEEIKGVQDIITRWTLRMTVSILPWKPTARFSGISVYKVQPSPKTKNGIVIVGQTDYWDSVNIQPNSNGQYQTVGKLVAINDFLDQLKPGGFQAQSAAPELPYQLLRKGDGYEGMNNEDNENFLQTDTNNEMNVSL